VNFADASFRAQESLSSVWQKQTLVSACSAVCACDWLHGPWAMYGAVPGKHTRARRSRQSSPLHLHNVEQGRRRTKFCLLGGESRGDCAEKPHQDSFADDFLKGIFAPPSSIYIAPEEEDLPSASSSSLLRRETRRSRTIFHASKTFSTPPRVGARGAANREPKCFFTRLSLEKETTRENGSLFLFSALRHSRKSKK